MTVRVAVLGPLCVREGRAEVDVGGRLRRLLAALAVRPGQVVSTDRLVDIVWSGEPPEHARETLRTYVHRLRHIVGDDAVRHVAPGYLLDLPRDQIDACRFESSLESAGELVDSDPARAVEVLQESLALWQGRAFAEFADEEWARPRSVQLEESRWTATEELVEARLRLGEHEDVIPVLRALIAENALRDRPRRQLMLALYRSGRQPEALRAFQEFRRVLDEELGLRPSDELRLLEEQIARHDPALRLVRPAGHALRGYRLGEQIGAGPVGTTYRAVQPAVEREVAVKIIRSELANNPEFVRRFDIEAQLVARLEHPHIVPLYDYWREPDGAFLVMRLLRGGSVADHLGESPWELERVSKLVDQIGDALAVAHRAGVAHGDVRPSNILLDEAGNGFLADFGIATVVAAGVAAGSAVASTRTLPAPVSDGAASAVGDVRSLAAVVRLLLGPSPATLDEDGRYPPLAEVRPDLPLAVSDVLVAATDPDPAQRPADAGAFRARFLAAASGRRVATVHAEPSAGLPGNPYKGLRPFLEADAPDFFGRERVVDDLLGRLGRGDRLVALVGPSGCGKSSVVRAGLLPALRRGAVDGSERWFLATMTPGAHPLDELEGALSRVAVRAPGPLREMLTDGHGLSTAVTRLLPEEDGELLLVIDQFEELFTLTASDERTELLELVAEAVAPGERHVRVVITLRADFFDRLLASHRLGPSVGDATVPLAALAPDGLDRAITSPAARVGVVVEPDLVSSVVAEVVDRAVALPLLQYTLTELFDQRADHTLTLGAYERLGGVTGTMARRAEEAYAALDPPDREAARRLLTRLVTVSDGGQITSRRSLRRDLVDVLGERARAAATIDAFVAARLLAVDRDPRTREPTVELAHEALVSDWARLRGWVEERRELIGQLRHLSAAYEEWRESGEQVDFLLSGTRLAQAEACTATDELLLTAAEHDFLDRSRAHEDQRAARLRIRRRTVTGVLAAAAVIFLVLAGLALVQRNRADDQAQRREQEALVNRVRELAAASAANVDTDPELAALLASEAIRTSRSADGTVLREAEEALHAAVADLRLIAVLPGSARAAFTPDGAVITGDVDARVWDPDTGGLLLTLADEGEQGAVAVSPDGSRFATGTADGAVSVWDADGARRWTNRRGHTDIVLDVTFSADGRFLASAGRDGQVVVREAETGEEVSRFRGPEHMRTVEFDADASHVLVASVFNRDALIGEVATGEWTATLPSRDLSLVAARFLPGGEVVATSGDEVVRMYDPSREAQLSAAYSSSFLNFGLAVSPDGAMVATGGDSGLVQLWATTPEGMREIDRLTGHTGGIDWLAFSGDSTRLVSVGGSGTDASEVRIWDVTPERSREHLTIDSGVLGSAAAYSSDGSLLATGLDPDRVVVHDASNGRPVGELSPAFGDLGERYPEYLEGLAFSPDGTLLATSTWNPGIDGTVALWDVESGELLRTLAEGTEGRGDVAFTPDGRLVAASTCSRSSSVAARVWDVQSGEVIFEVPGCGRGIALSDDGDLLAVDTRADRDNIRVWDLRSGEQVATFTLPAAILGPIELSADGAVLVAGGVTSVKVWDVATGEELVDLGPASAGTYDVALSPDEGTIGTANADGTVRTWDATTGGELLRLQVADTGEVRELHFHPDGTRLAVVAAGKTRVLVLDVDELLELTEARLTRGLTEAECETYHFDPCPG